MKKRFGKFLIAILMIVMGFGLIYLPVKADSGWDYDYDSGGWDSGGSDWDYDYDSGGWGSDYDYGGSSYGSGGSIGSVVFLIIILVVIIICIKGINRNPNVRKMKYSAHRNDNNYSLNNYHDIDITKIKLVDPNLNIDEFKNKVFNIYRDLQIAWMNFDKDTIRKLTTDEVYNMYCSQLDVLKLKGQKNIMKDITLDDVKLINIEEVNGVITATVFLAVKCYDYVINESNGFTVRGTNNLRVSIDYVLTFVKSSINDNKVEKCPNCGAPVEMNSSNVCEFCDSTLVKNSSDYVMSKKVVVGQRTVR